MIASPQSTNPAVAALAKGVSPAVLEAINSKVSPDDIAEAIRDMLDATLANGQKDWRAVEIAVKTYLAYTVGLPIQRQEVVTHKIISKPSPERLLNTPGAADALVRTLPAADRAKLLAALSKAGTVDV